MLDLQSVYFGQRHPKFDYKDFDLIKKISRLTRKHHKQCENSCNGIGYVNGQCYYNGTIDVWAKQTYGRNVKSAYIGDTEDNIFDQEASKIEDKIKALIADNKDYCVEFQGDPRGATVKLYYEGGYIEL